MRRVRMQASSTASVLEPDVRAALRSIQGSAEIQGDLLWLPQTLVPTASTPPPS